MEKSSSKSATRSNMLQAESSSAPKSGSPSSEAMQELQKRTPTKRQGDIMEEFKSPSLPKQFTPKILKHNSRAGGDPANVGSNSSHKSPSRRPAFWALSSSAKKLAEAKGNYQFDAPWPSPAQTGLRRHVNSLRMNMGGRPGQDLFASPINVTPGSLQKTEAGPSVPSQIRPWSTSPMQREGSVLKAGIPRILTSSIAPAKHSDQHPSKEAGEQKSESGLPEKTDGHSNQTQVNRKFAHLIGTGKTQATGTGESSLAKSTNMSYKKWPRDSIFGHGGHQHPSASKVPYPQPPVGGHGPHQNESYATASFYGSQAKPTDVLNLGGPLFSETEEQALQIYNGQSGAAAQGSAMQYPHNGGCGYPSGRHPYMHQQLAGFNQYRPMLHGSYMDGLHGQHPGHMPVYMHPPPQMHMPSCAHHPMHIRRQIPVSNQSSTNSNAQPGNLSPTSREQQQQTPTLPQYYCPQQQMMAAVAQQAMCNPCQFCVHHHPQCALNQARHHVFCNTAAPDSSVAPPMIASASGAAPQSFKRPQLKLKQQTPESLNSKKPVRNQGYGSPEPKRLDFADGEEQGEKSIGLSDDEVDTPLSHKKQEQEAVVLHMPHQLQENLRKSAHLGMEQLKVTKVQTASVKSQDLNTSGIVISKPSVLIKSAQIEIKPLKSTMNPEVEDKSSESQAQLVAGSSKRRMFVVNPETGEMERIIRKRKRKNNNQLHVLVDTFDQNENWTKEVLLEVSKRTSLTEAQVYKWGWDQKRKKYGVEVANQMMQWEKDQNALAARKAKQAQKEGGLDGEIEAMPHRFDDESLNLEDSSPEFQSVSVANKRSKHHEDVDVNDFEFNGQKTPQNIQETGGRRNFELLTTGASYKRQLSTPKPGQHAELNDSPAVNAGKKSSAAFQKAIAQTTLEMQPSLTSIDLMGNLNKGVLKTTITVQNVEESAKKTPEPQVTKRQLKAKQKAEAPAKQQSSTYSLRVRKSTAEAKRAAPNSKTEVQTGEQNNKENKVVRLQLQKSSEVQDQTEVTKAAQVVKNRQRRQKAAKGTKATPVPSQAPTAQ